MGFLNDMDWVRFFSDDSGLDSILESFRLFPASQKNVNSPVKSPK